MTREQIQASRRTLLPPKLFRLVERRASDPMLAFEIGKLKPAEMVLVLLEREYVLSELLNAKGVDQ